MYYIFVGKSYLFIAEILSFNWKIPKTKGVNVITERDL